MVAWSLASLGGSQENVSIEPAGVMMLRKCKFMEESGGCKNLCLNICKAGTEEYMAKELGMPLRMIPNLEAGLVQASGQG